MLDIKTILLPVDFPNTSLPVIHQAATLARRFHSEIIALHVVNAESHAAGIPESASDLANWNMVAEIVRGAGKTLDHSLGPQLDGLAIRPVLVSGDPAQAIVETAQAQEADLIMMPSHGYTFTRFLLGSESAETTKGVECPVWTSAHVEESSSLSSPLPLPSSSLKLPQDFAVRKVLCAIDFTPHSEVTVSWAAYMAREFDARLTLAHVTPDVGIWAPGGTYVNPKLKAELVEDAAGQMAQLQQNMDVKPEIFVGSGDVSEVLTRAAEQTKADLLVNECYPYGGNLRLHGFGVISVVPIPVLSV
jgi:nucleotide-binding universal stress UspA family protein